jgi:catechol 2,3-dioxygenase-like lactoylglutathione lyase family enzyme
MMRLEHINLVVRDLDKTLDFYRAAFPQWDVRGGGKDEWYGHPREWLHFGDDYNYLTFNDSGKGENRDLKSVTMGLAHFAFETRNLDAVVDRLNAAGYEVRLFGAENTYRKNAYFIDPNGYEVEFVEYLSDIPEQRNSYQ